MMVKKAQTTEQIDTCHEVLLALRPHVKRDVLTATIMSMFTNGYHLAYIEQDGKAVAAIGYRYQHFLYNGKHIYIDDLSTLTAFRGHGFAGKLLAYVEEEARANGVHIITLDSGHHWKDAHRLYMNAGYSITCHHFEKTLA